jgi:hypothetical protein
VAIVAANKARNAVLVDIGPVLWENRLAQSYLLSADKTRQQTNRDAVAELIAALDRTVGNSTKSSSGFQARYGVPLDVVLDFFKSFRGHPQDPYWGEGRAAVAPIAEAFRDAKGAESWGVVFVTGSGPEVDLGLGVRVAQSIRNKMVMDDDLIVLRNRRVSTPQDLVAALSEDDRAAITSRLDLAMLPPEKKALAQIEHPILMIYALTTVTPDPPDGLQPVDIGPDSPLIAVAVAFPRLDLDQALRAARNAKRYLVNTVWLRNAMGLTDDGDDLDDEEDEV